PVLLQLVNGSSRCAGQVQVFIEQQWVTVCNDGWDLLDAAVVCRQLEPPQLRLVNGLGPCTGRVEVLHNEQWGTVCDEGWDLPDAEVACWQLGCGVAISANGSAQFGQGSGTIWLTEVQCQGSEGTLAACRAKPWGVHHCSHQNDAGVVCAEPSEVRLVNGSGRCSGRVEVLHEERWGSVCGHGWDLLDAEVVCRELGCGAALSASGSALFGQGHGPVWLDGVNCTGMEEALSKCPAEPWGVHACGHEKDAAAVCSDPTELRLVNGSGRCSGRLEVLHEQRWGSVCDAGWDLLDALVVCWQLGCGAALAAPRSAHFGHGHGPFWLDRVHCTGREAALSECPAEPFLLPVQHVELSIRGPRELAPLEHGAELGAVLLLVPPKLLLQCLFLCCSHGPVLSTSLH
ncbi:PREDICTED: scavenger receptor cysteine-rich domain-containing group B protein-like, partial [Tinamus guttatus]|uniref:scavenger receptor cysteine-rich domain-containing group B protein-like n=1 Tax=Tinamus guttatus TaxID=94827 RepID=UPI00052F234B